MRDLAHLKVEMFIEYYCDDTNEDYDSCEIENEFFNIAEQELRVTKSYSTSSCSSSQKPTCKKRKSKLNLEVKENSTGSSTSVSTAEESK